MTRISDNLARIAALKQAGLAGHAAADRLSPLHGFANPGALGARRYVPEGLAAGAPLVVVLHGCTQTAAGYDHGSGWSTLADRAGFALLFPEQSRSNNPNLCFNWFAPGDIGRVGGEAESIANMVDAMVLAHDLDPARIFVTGLSAGGAMTAAMLATYPEKFAGGAIIGGLPYGGASNVPEALDRMRGTGGPGDAEAVALVRRASGGHQGPWPTVSVWHGTADATVVASNLGGIGRQWRGVHGVAGAGSVERVDGQERRRWRDASGRCVVEEWSIAGMGHGVPLDPTGVDALGAAGAYMLDVGVSSTAEIARSWGLVDDVRPARRSAPVVANDASVPAPPERRATSAGAEPAGVQKVIEDALRSAGLMR